jgi:uncharacterized protein YndB with AHSA1/START domain
MTTTTLETLRIARRFNAAPERVFDAWIDPMRARRWLFTSPTSERHTTELDARVGGKWSITDRRDGVDFTALGEYVEIDRPRRLVFSFAMPQFSSMSCNVTVEIVPDGDGCVLTLSQESVIAEHLKATEAGWSAMFDALAVGLDVGRGYGALAGPRTLRFERLLPGPIERVWAYLTQSDKRAQWLAAGEMTPTVGAVMSWRFRHANLSPHVVPTPGKYAAMQDGHDIHPRLTRFEPPRLFGFIWDEARDPSEVVFELTAVGDKVRLVLTQDRLADRPTMVSAASGWHAHLAVLNERLNDRVPPPFWTLHGDLEAVYEKRLPAE